VKLSRLLHTSGTGVVLIYNKDAFIYNKNSLFVRFRVQVFLFFLFFRFRVQGLGFRFQFIYLFLGLGFRVQLFLVLKFSLLYRKTPLLYIKIGSLGGSSAS
jgi:hypothetical protein